MRPHKWPPRVDCRLVRKQDRDLGTKLFFAPCTRTHVCARHSQGTVPARHLHGRHLEDALLLQVRQRALRDVELREGRAVRVIPPSETFGRCPRLRHDASPCPCKCVRYEIVFNLRLLLRLLYIILANLSRLPMLTYLRGSASALFSQAARGRTAPRLPPPPAPPAPRPPRPPRPAAARRPHRPGPPRGRAGPSAGRRAPEPAGARLGGGPAEDAPGHLQVVLATVYQTAETRLFGGRVQLLYITK